MLERVTRIELVTKAWEEMHKAIMLRRLEHTLGGILGLYINFVGLWLKYLKGQLIKFRFLDGHSLRQSQLMDAD